MKRDRLLIVAASVALVLWWRGPAAIGILHAQAGQPAGRSIGRISTTGDLILFELDEGALGKANVFDLEKRTLRFTPSAGGYRAENVPLQWDAEFGAEASAAQVQLRGFAFPFSGKTWDALSVGVAGSIAFGAPAAGPGGGAPGGGRGGGVSIGRFDQLQEAARALVNAQPAICVFMKPRMSGTRYVKELADRVVITWTVTEPVGGIQDFTWVPTTNRFQAVLHKDGVIEMSYDQLAAKDAIVGVYPLVNGGIETAIASFKDAENAAVPAHLDVTNLRVSSIDGLSLAVTLETRGPVLPEGDPGIVGLVHAVKFTKSGPGAGAAEAVWTVRGVMAGGRGGRGAASATPRYIASGPGVPPAVKVSGNSLSVRGLLPEGFRAGDEVTITVQTMPAGGSAGDTVASRPIRLSGLQNPEIDLSAVTPKDGPFPALFESFHYVRLPNPRDMTCTVIKSLGDKFDFLAYYSDFRVDNQEAGTPSTGPLGGGPDGGAVTGIGAAQRGLDSYCSAGRFQWQFVQPVFVGSNQMQERPPDSVTDTNTHNIAAYRQQIGERTPDRKLVPYDYALSQIGHEMGHRWSAFVSAKVGNETIPLGPTHWARGLHAPVAFPFQRPSEASAMGGGVWQDNFDGTFTQLDDDYYVPATGWSYLDLYLMGLISAAEVPDFFILRNLTATGRDATGHPIFKADRTKVTIQDVIAVEGQRRPDVDHAQKQFNTGMVVMVEHGRTPSRELVDRVKGIREGWIDYFATTTGHRASMTATVPK